LCANLEPSEGDLGAKSHRDTREQFEREFAAQRSHQDVAAANEHTKSLDQWILVLNGAAATATLTFISSRTVMSIRWPILVFASLGFFAIGAAFGAAAMRAHSRALYEWLYFWSLRAGISDDQNADEEEIKTKIIPAYKDAMKRATQHDLYYRMCIISFLFGCLCFGIAFLSNSDRQRTQVPAVSEALLLSTAAVALNGPEASLDAEPMLRWRA
jgi:hypothetical protein